MRHWLKAAATDDVDRLVSKAVGEPDRLARIREPMQQVDGGGRDGIGSDSKRSVRCVPSEAGLVCLNYTRIADSARTRQSAAAASRSVRRL